MAPCKHCGHPASDHLDRAVVACAPEAQKPYHGYQGMLVVPKKSTFCACPGYEASPC